MKTHQLFTGAVITTLVIITLCRHEIFFGARRRRIIRRHLQDVLNFENEIAIAKSVQDIKVREYARFSYGISRIIHNPAKREVTVIIESHNRCPNPILFGRLSGRALALLHWEKREDNIIRGYYDVPFTGPFYIDIILLFCHFDDTTMDNCMIPARFNRITAFETEIVTEIPTPFIKGYWRADKHKRLKTRWQPLGCRERPDKYCNEKTSIFPFIRYKFVTEDPYMKKGLSTVNYKIDWKRESKSGYNCYRDTEDRCKVCTVGASHSARLSRFLSTAVGLDQVGNVKVQFPVDMDEETAQYVTDRCETIIVGFGQHNIKYGKTLPLAFGWQMKSLLSLFRSHPRVFMRSMHYNPLGDEKHMCPPEDGRNPYLIDQYNIVLSELCKELDIPWIDTRWIDGPMWDSGEDWNHLHFSVEIVQAFYVAQVVGL